MKKETLKKSLNRMGVPIYPDGQVLREDILALPFQNSGLTIEQIKPIKTEKHSDCFSHRVHLKIKGGDTDKIDQIFEK